MPGARVRARRGIILPAVLGALVALALLSALALFDAVQESRVATLADDRVLARAALHEGLDAASDPPDLAYLCVSAPVNLQVSAGVAAGGGRYLLEWSHLGRGLVRVSVSGRGRSGARAGAIALLRPDSADASGPGYSCPRATRLGPVGPGWVVAAPDG